MLMKFKNFVFWVVYILIIIYLMVYIPTFWGHKPLVVISGSMAPTLKVGGILYYHEQNIEDFKIGDILVYQAKDHTISHRIVDFTENGFITKGDANNAEDPNIVNYSQLLGKGTNWSIPYIGYYADFIYSHKYLLFISLAITILDLSSDMYISHKKKFGEENEKN